MAKVIRQAKCDKLLRYPVSLEMSVEDAEKEAERLTKLFGDRAIYTVEKV